MKIKVQTTISRPKEDVWKVITNIEASPERISGIEKLEVLERPDEGLIGFKWRETRTMFGKTATEDMWITDLVENDYYNVRAESHGAIYKSTLKVESQGEQTVLSMEFSGEPQNFITKVMSAIMMPFFKGATVKALQKDMDDIKEWMEKQPA